MSSPAASRRSSIEVESQATSALHAEEAVLDRRHANVLGIRVEPLDMVGALVCVADALALRRKGYICMGGVHGIMEAQRSPDVRCAFSDSMLTLPDGMPTVWVGRSQGFTKMRRVAGPDLMLEIFRNKQFADFSHFFYGGKPGVALELAANLKRRFPWVRIAGTFTPPFRDLNREEEYELIERVRETHPSIVWVGISSPRQELFMRKYLPLLETTLMFGVGAAFDFHTGRIKDSAEWVKCAGLQWLHRLVQDPKHLLWRYLRNNPAFLWRIGLELLHFDGVTHRRRRLVQQDKRSVLCESSSES